MSAEPGHHPPPARAVLLLLAGAGALLVAAPAIGRRPAPPGHAASPPPRLLPPDPPAPPAAADRIDPREGIRRAIAFTVVIEGEGVYGAGILLSPAAGLVLTAHHVIEGVKAPRVTFHDGKSEPARVIDLDRALDAALLQVPPQPDRPAPVLGDATGVRPGDEVFAVGDPRRLGFSVSRGIISYSGRQLDGTSYLQTDLPINDGNSGGPLIDARGELLGMMSFIYRRSQGLSFALPVNYAPLRFAALTSLPEDPTYIARFQRWLDGHSALRR